MRDSTSVGPVPAPSGVARAAVLVAMVAAGGFLTGCTPSEGAAPGGEFGCDPNGFGPLSGCASTDTSPSNSAAAEPGGTGWDPLTDDTRGECPGEPYAGQVLAVCQQDGGWVVEGSPDGRTLVYVVVSKSTDDPDCPWRIFAEADTPQGDWLELCTSRRDWEAQAVGQRYHPTDAEAQRVYELVGGR